MGLVWDMWISMGRSNKDFIDGQVPGRNGKRVSLEVERMKGESVLRDSWTWGTFRGVWKSSAI